MDNKNFKQILLDLRSFSIEVDIPYLISVLLIGIGISLFMRWYYIRYGRTNTNRELVADSFPLLIISITLIIYLIKSSLALSLGLVGALSIVRFRAAIKEPEELVYLLFVIALGLGLGAKQVTAVLIIFIITIIFLFLWNKFRKSEKIGNKIIISLNLKKNKNNIDILNDWIKLINKYGKVIELYRYEEDRDFTNASFTIDKIEINEIENLKNEIFKLDENVEISVIDSTRDLILT